MILRKINEKSSIFKKLMISMVEIDSGIAAAH